MSFGFRTPSKGEEKTKQALTHTGNPSKKDPTPKKDDPNLTFKVRRSIGEWEANLGDAPPKMSPTETSAQESAKAKTGTVPKVDSKTTPTATLDSINKTSAPKYIDRISEARANVTKAKLHLNNSRNLKTEIKAEVITAIDRLYQLVKESEARKGGERKTGKEKEVEPDKEQEQNQERDTINAKLMDTIHTHARLIQENNEKMKELRETLEKQSVMIEKRSYASVVSNIRDPTSRPTALHSVVVTSKNEMETSEEVLERIRKVVNAKDGGITIDKVRKAKDRKVIVGCRTEMERNKVKDKLQTAEEFLKVEEVCNKNPLVILKDVMTYNTDEDVLGALRKQNPQLYKDLDEDHTKAEIAYKRRTRNPLTNHIVMRVPAMLWKRLTETGTVHIDLQRIRVEDQSPLVQCSMCLGYGHGRRFCTESQEKCSHCGGPHKKAECADFMACAPPSCCNCVRAKMDRTDHNAFSQDCPIKKKWDALARSSVAYC